MINYEILNFILSLTQMTWTALTPLPPQNPVFFTAQAVGSA
jgi:hypothetical protein